MYKFYNANSHNNFINDCFPRAYSVVMNITWTEAYKETYIGEFAENHPIGKYLITTNNHITACVDGYIIDTWDCTNRKIEYIWKIL